MASPPGSRPSARAGSTAPPCWRGSAPRSPLPSPTGAAPRAREPRLFFCPERKRDPRFRGGDERGFALRYLPLSDTDRSEMLRVVGATDIDELFKDVPEE